MNEILIQTIVGIDREIVKRNRRLTARRFWLLDEFRDCHYSWRGFYLGGYKILKEIEKLGLIRDDLESKLLSQGCVIGKSFELQQVRRWRTLIYRVRENEPLPF
jgi:hypothetical protein